MNLCAVLCYSLGIISSLSQVSHGSEDILRIPIGFSVWDTYSDVFRTMKYAMEKHLNDSDKLFQFNIYADKIRTVDAHKLTKIGKFHCEICSSATCGH